MKKRNANLELLRIVAMFMIIFLHYLGKGNTLILPGAEGYNVNSVFAWGLEAFCAGAINLYVLISGYFSVSSEFKMERGIKIWLQVGFYSLTIFAIMYFLGQVPAQECTNVYYLAEFFLPLTRKQYWFASVYIVFFLLSPFLARGIKALSKKQHFTLIILLLFFYTTLLPTIIPTTAVYDDRGFGIVWFVCLFTIASYIRLYVKIDGKKLKWLLIYVASSLCTVGWLYGINIVYEKTGKLVNLISIFYNYNSPLTILGSTALFLVFLNMNIKDGFISRAINGIGGLTFGIYLLHEHYLLRDLWIDFWKVDQYYQKPIFIVHCVVVCVIVFTVCAVVEFLRQQLFGLLFKLPPWKFFCTKLHKLDSYFNHGKEEMQ